MSPGLKDEMSAAKRGQGRKPEKWPNVARGGLTKAADRAGFESLQVTVLPFKVLNPSYIIEWIYMEIFIFVISCGLAAGH